ncbi:MAG: glutaredoxin [Alphaproteobacteria bacterium]|nr:glutaredoxin [Alphaproteobacteria bacterium]
MFGGQGTVRTNAPSPAERHALVLYKYDSCPFCRRVLAAIDRLGIEDVEMRDTMMDPSARRELRDATGRTTVPCLFIDGQPMFESLDIVAWLQAYKEGALAG